LIWGRFKLRPVCADDEIKERNFAGFEMSVQLKSLFDQL